MIRKRQYSNYYKKKKYFLGGSIATVSTGSGAAVGSQVGMLGGPIGMMLGSLAGQGIGALAGKLFKKKETPPPPLNPFQGNTASSYGNFAMGGYAPLGPDSVKYIGPKHKDGGILIDENGMPTDNEQEAIAEVEGGETRDDNYIFSDELKYPGTDLTFAEVHETMVETGASEQDIEELKAIQEEVRESTGIAAKERAGVMKNGGDPTKNLQKRLNEIVSPEEKEIRSQRANELYSPIIARIEEANADSINDNSIYNMKKLRQLQTGNVYSYLTGYSKRHQMLFDDYMLRNPIPQDSYIAKELQKIVGNLSDEQVRNLMSRDYSKKGIVNNISALRDAGIPITSIPRYIISLNKANKQGYTMQDGGYIQDNLIKEKMYGGNMKYGKGGKMIKRADGSYSRRGLWDNIRANKGSGKKPTKQMLEQERKIKAAEKMMGGALPEYGKGGYTVTKSDRKGKTHKVTGPDGTVKHFGDPNLKNRPNNPKAKKSWYARHKKSLSKNPHFRAYARATWATGGKLPMYQMGGPDKINPFELPGLYSAASDNTNVADLTPEEIKAMQDDETRQRIVNSAPQATIGQTRYGNDQIQPRLRAKNTLDRRLGQLSNAFANLGMAPLVGEPFDVASGLVELIRGNPGMAAVSLASTAPLIGTPIRSLERMRAPDGARQLYRGVDSSGNAKELYRYTDDEASRLTDGTGRTYDEFDILRDQRELDIQPQLDRKAQNLQGIDRYDANTNTGDRSDFAKVQEQYRGSLIGDEGADFVDAIDAMGDLVFRNEAFEALPIRDLNSLLNKQGIDNIFNTLGVSNSKEFDSIFQSIGGNDRLRNLLSSSIPLGANATRENAAEWVGSTARSLRRLAPLLRNVPEPFLRKSLGVDRSTLDHLYRKLDDIGVLRINDLDISPRARSIEDLTGIGYDTPLPRGPQVTETGYYDPKELIHYINRQVHTDKKIADTISNAKRNVQFPGVYGRNPSTGDLRYNVDADNYPVFDFSDRLRPGRNKVFEPSSSLSLNSYPMGLQMMGKEAAEGFLEVPRYSGMKTFNPFGIPSRANLHDHPIMGLRINEQIMGINDYFGDAVLPYVQQSFGDFAYPGLNAALTGKMPRGIDKFRERVRQEVLADPSKGKRVYKNGGSIDIAPEKRGTFKAQATRMGMGVQEAASTILAAPKGKYPPAMRRKANFAKNFAKRNGGNMEYGYGGKMKYGDGGPLETAAQFLPEAMNFARGVFSKPNVPPATQIERTRIPYQDTTYNINPALQSSAAAYRGVMADPAMSANQKMAAYSQKLQNEGQLYGQKENIESQRRMQLASQQAQLDAGRRQAQSQYDEAARQERMMADANTGIFGNFAMQALTDAGNKYLQMQRDKKAQQHQQDLLEFYKKVYGVGNGDGGSTIGMLPPPLTLPPLFGTDNITYPTS